MSTVPQQQSKAPSRRCMWLAVLAAVLVGMMLGMLLVRTSYQQNGMVGRAEEPQNMTDTVGQENMSAALPRVAAALEWSELQQGKESTETVVLELEVPKVHMMQNNQAAQDLIVVLDTSGSMSGSRLHHAQQALCDLIDSLEGNQTMHLVQYGSSASVVFQSGKSHQASALKSAVRAMQTQGGTNLGAGLKLAQSLANSFAHRHSLCRVFVFSDGYVNQGMLGQKLTDFVQGMQEKGLPTTTFGIGEQYNLEVMTGIAEIGNGEFFHIASAADIEQVLAVVSRAFHNVYASDVRLELTIPSGIRLRSVFGAKQGTTKDYGDAQAVAVPLTDLVSGEKRLLSALLDVQMDFVKEVGTKPIVTYQVSFDILAANSERRSVVGGKINVTIVEELGPDVVPNHKATHAAQLHELVKDEGERLQDVLNSKMSIMSQEFFEAEEESEEHAASYVNDCNKNLGSDDLVCQRLHVIKKRKARALPKIRRGDMILHDYASSHRRNSLMAESLDEL